MAISSAILAEHNLTGEEYERIVKALGREPNRTELGLFSVMWSEHCSYKSSKIHLRTLPTQGPRVLQGPGENAGVVDLGDGLAAVFKIESHNHPSFIEPYQGAATGVGGILRDIFTMGARPIAILNSLRFGPPQETKSRRLLSGVVAGIGGYGNAFGCPTVGGEVAFEECYRQNPLVNAFCLGIVKSTAIFRGRAEGVGNTVFYVGAKTGRDGIHGATMASAEFGQGSEERRPTVQVGDPFLEKVLLEACLEALKTGAVVGIQDMGAAGLTCSTSEMGARAGTGVEIDIEKVPKRETGMSAYEVMLSESQERMLVVVEPGREDDLAEVFARWDLEASVVGEVTADGLLVIEDGDEVVASVPVALLTDGAPVRRLEGRPPAHGQPLLDLDRLAGVPLDPGGVLLRLLGSPNLGSRRPVFRRYDHMVGDATVGPPGGDAAVLRLPGSRLGLAVTIDGNGRYCWLDPRIGAQIAVAEAARNLVATGARPLAVTDCLNFGNPERPEVYWQLQEAVAGISSACLALGVPVVSGNVSLYNESEAGGAIHPTPVIGMVGLLDDHARRLAPAFVADGDFVLLVGRSANDLGGSEYLKVVHGQVAGPPPAMDLAAERASHQVVLEAAAAGLLRSAHDVAEGGTLVALAECCLLGGRGARCGTLKPERDVRLDAAFFGESQGRFVVSATARSVPALQQLARGHGVRLTLLGMTGGDRIEFDGQLRVPLQELREAWEGALLDG
jgi:phosphoribosylformylglycinamidine synthase II